MDATLPFDLHQRRLAAGLSLTSLARLTGYDRNYVRRVERGLRQPSADFIRACDAMLGAAVPTTGPSGGRPGPAARPEPLALVEPGQVEAFALIFDQVRHLGQVVDTATVLQSALHLFDTVSRLAAAGGPQRSGLSRLAGRCAEFVGWLYQEQNRTEDAHRFTEIARTVGGCPDLAAYTWVRHAEISLAAGDPDITLRLAGRAYQHRSAAPRVRGLAAHRIAQAHATRRMARDCRLALDNARRLFDQVDDPPARARELGTSNVRNICMATAGWCDHELGRHEQAIEKLTVVMRQIPRQAHRARAVFGARLAVAYAAAGEPYLAHNVGRSALADVRYTASGTARSDLSRLARLLVRRRETRTEALELHLDLAQLGPANAG